MEAYLARQGTLGLEPAQSLRYWLGVTRITDPALLESNRRGSWHSLPGSYLPLLAPSNGQQQAPLFAPYAHWSPLMWEWGRMEGYGGEVGVVDADCVMASLEFG